MSVNKYRSHVMVLPEDDANRQIANGFVLEMDPARLRRIQILPEAGGWNEVLERFLSEIAGGMIGNANRFMVLLVDFDEDAGRLEYLKARIPSELIDRTYILGALGEPEGLRTAGLGSYESIGRALAKGCLPGVQTIWDHPLLRHNTGELERLREKVHPIIFGPD